MLGPNPSVDRQSSATSLSETQDLDRVEQPRDEALPRRVPAAVQEKMKLLESWQSSKVFRVAKNVGAGLVGAGIALALASNPVGWAVAGSVLAVGGVMALTGTIMTTRADFARLDVEAYKQSLASDQPNQEASGGRKALAFALNVLESAAFGVAGFFAGAGIGAAVHPHAFAGMVGAKQGLGNTLATEIALPAIYGIGSTLASVPGFLVDNRRNQPNPGLHYQMNISEGLPEFTGTLNQDIPESAASRPFYKKGSELARGARSERTPVTVTGPLVRHFAQTGNRNINGHRAVGAQLPPRIPPTRIVVDDRKLLEALSHQERDWTTEFVKSFGYAAKRIPDNQPLFGNGPPKLEDLRQSHNRGNCYLVAALASALVRENGWQKIEQIMQDNNDGTVTVRLPQADVVVQKTRLVTEQGYSSFDSGEDWAHLLEKAVAAYQLTQEDGRLKATDDGHYSDAFRYLGHLMGPPNENAADIAVSGQHDIHWDMTVSSYAPDWHRIIDHSLANGHPVAFSTQNNKYQEKMMKRILPGHKYAIAGMATRDNKRGYLVFDPHSISAGPYPSRTSTNHAITYSHAQRGNSPVFFVGVDEAGTLFDHLLYAHSGAPPPPQESLIQV